MRVRASEGAGEDWTANRDQRSATSDQRISDQRSANHDFDRNNRMAAKRAGPDHVAMMNIAIAPLPTSFLDRVRQQGIDDLGQPVKRLRAEGGEPCRDVLRRAEPGEELILASFSPFQQAGPYHEYGPVFILANPANDASSRDALPIPTNYLREQFVLRAYREDESIRDAALVTRESSQETLERFLADPETAFVHARFPVYGCFALRVDRA